MRLPSDRDESGEPENDGQQDQSRLSGRAKDARAKNARENQAERKANRAASQR